MLFSRSTLPMKKLILLMLVAFWGAFFAVSANAQTPAAKASAMSMPTTGAQHSMKGSDGMKQSMMRGSDAMQKMPMTGDPDRDFAMMMKLHHQQGVDMAEMQLMHGKSPAMKSMAKQIIAAQNKEIAQFDRWLGKQK
jgi:uncharacterized protein (DUF305 family)